MEIITNKHNNEVAIRRINHNALHLISDRSRFRKRVKNGELLSYDFNGGPNLSIGGRLFFEGLFWKIESIKILPTSYELNEVRVEVTPQYQNAY
jgi:hypothetical protein